MSLKMKLDYPLFRLSNLQLLNRVILEDEFDDAAKAAFVGCTFSDGYLAFVERNLLDGPTLDLGCGSGTSFTLLPISSALDANPTRHRAARQAGEEVWPHVDVRLGASECLPFEPGSHVNVLYLHGFFQVRSDYEVLLEVNRVLRGGGRFIFDFPHASRQNLEFGRVLEPRAYIRVMRDFGFELVERRTIDDWDEAVCVEKVEDFDYSRMKKLQLVDAGKGTFFARNLRKDDYTIR